MECLSESPVLGTAQELMNDEVQASEQERAQILFERVRVQVEANRMKGMQRLEERQRKTLKPRHGRA